MSWIVERLEIQHGGHHTIRSMQGLRGVAVVLVFFVHYCSIISPWIKQGVLVENVRHFIYNFGNTGVDIFFVLSGYLIYGSIIRKNNFKVIYYIKRRIMIIYPTFIFVLALYIILSYFFPAESKLPNGIGKTINYLVQNFFLMPGLFAIRPIMPVAWSLSYEVLYYAIIPILILSFRLKSISCNSRIIFWMILATISYFLLSTNNGPTRLLMFISGVLLFEFHHYKKVRCQNGIGTLSLIICLIIFGRSNISNYQYNISIIYLFSFIFFLCLESFNENTFTSKWLSINVVRWLGNISYSFYLIHVLVLKAFFLIFKKFFPPSNQFDLTFYWIWIPLLILTTIVSFGLFNFIERPLSFSQK